MLIVTDIIILKNQSRRRPDLIRLVFLYKYLARREENLIILKLFGSLFFVYNIIWTLSRYILIRIDVLAPLLILRKYTPCTALFWSARLLFLRKYSPCKLMPSCIGICPAHLLILRKNSPLHGLILVCTFNVF